MEKAKLTKAQAEALNEHLEHMYDDQIMDIYSGPTEPKTMNWRIIQNMHPALLARALYLGYEVIEEDQTIVVTAQTKKEILELFASPSGSNEFERGFELGVDRILTLTGIKVKGINA